MKITGKVLGLVLMVAVLGALPLLAACGNDDESEEPTAKPTTTLKLGNITDITGPAAPAMNVVDAAFADLVKYFNDNDLIPGLNLEIISYDSQYDPSKAVPAYRWVLQQGADIVFTGLPPIISTIYPMATNDQVALISILCDSDAIKPPTWNFAFNVPTETFVYTAMKWIAENDPDFPQDRPAKIGGVGMAGSYAQQLQTAGEAYAKAHPDQYEWVNGFIVGWETMTFSTEVDAFKNADYIIPPETGIYLANFIKEYRAAGGTANFIGTDAHNAYLGLILDALGGWDQIDGMLFCVPNRWYNEESEVTDLMNQLLKDYHAPGEAASFRKAGSAYQGAFHQIWGMLMLLQKTAKEHGAENVKSQTIYDTATSFELKMDGGQHISFSETKRASWDYFGIYRASAADQDLMRIGANDWWPVRYEP